MAFNFWFHPFPGKGLRKPFFLLLLTQTGRKTSLVGEHALSRSKLGVFLIGTRRAGLAVPSHILHVANET